MYTDHNEIAEHLEKNLFKMYREKTDYLLKKNKQTNNHNNGGRKVME